MDRVSQVMSDLLSKTWPLWYDALVIFMSYAVILLIICAGAWLAWILWSDIIGPLWDRAKGWRRAYRHSRRT